MPWVPLAESGVAFVFLGGPLVSLDGSTVSGDATGTFGGIGWEISFPGDAVQTRVTVQSYFSPDPFGEAPSYFSFDGTGLIENEITGEATEFLPNPVEFGSPVSFFSYNSGAGSETYRPDVFVMLVEVWEDGPEPPGECNEIGRVSRAYVSAHDRTRVHNTRLYPREKRCLVANFNGAIPAGRSIVTATWEMEVASSVSIANPSIAGRSAQVMIQACYRGIVGMRCQVELDNGEIYNQLFVVQVLDGPYFGDENTAPGPTKVSVSA